MQPEELKLVVVAAPKPCGPFHLRPEHDRPFIVGRGGDSDISLPGDCISRRHCRLYIADGRWFVEDLGSGNGTCVNNVRISAPQEIKDADRLKVGDIAFLVHLKTSPTAARRRGSPPVPRAKAGRTFAPVSVKKSSARPRGMRPIVKWIGSAIVALVLVAATITVFTISRQNGQSAKTVAAVKTPPVVGDKPPLPPPPVLPESAFLPKKTSKLLDICVGAGIVVRLIESESGEKRTEATLPEKCKLIVRLPFELKPKAFEVIRSWRGNVDRTGPRPKLAEEPIGLVLAATEPFLLSEKRIRAGAVLTRSRQGWTLHLPGRKDGAP